MHMKHDDLVIASFKSKGHSAVKTVSDLKIYRKKAKLTQKRMAAALGMPLSTYQSVEQGSNPFRKILRMAVLYHMTNGDPDDS